MILHSRWEGLCSYEECAHEAHREYPVCAHWYLKRARKQISSDKISLMWFVWFPSTPHENLFTLNPKAGRIMKACCPGRLCHSVTSPVSKWHSRVKECRVLARKLASRQISEAWSDTHGPSPHLWPPLYLCPFLLTPLLLGSHTLLCWSHMSRPPTTTTHFPVWAQSLFAEASIRGMCCDCAGLENTDVLFVVWCIVSWYYPCEMTPWHFSIQKMHNCPLNLYISRCDGGLSTQHYITLSSSWCHFILDPEQLRQPGTSDPGMIN